MSNNKSISTPMSELDTRVSAIIKTMKDNKAPLYIQQGAIIDIIKNKSLDGHTPEEVLLSSKLFNQTEIDSILKTSETKIDKSLKTAGEQFKEFSPSKDKGMMEWYPPGSTIAGGKTKIHISDLLDIKRKEYKSVSEEYEAGAKRREEGLNALDSLLGESKKLEAVWEKLLDQDQPGFRYEKEENRMLGSSVIDSAVSLFRSIFNVYPENHPLHVEGKLKSEIRDVDYKIREQEGRWKRHGWRGSFLGPDIFQKRGQMSIWGTKGRNPYVTKEKGMMWQDRHWGGSNVFGEIQDPEYKGRFNYMENYPVSRKLVHMATPPWSVRPFESMTGEDIVDLIKELKGDLHHNLIQLESDHMVRYGKMKEGWEEIDPNLKKKVLESLESIGD